MRILLPLVALATLPAFLACNHPPEDGGPDASYEAKDGAALQAGEFRLDVTGMT